MISSPPAARTSGRIRLKYSAGAGAKPPTPWIGSAMKAAILPSVVVARKSSKSSTRKSRYCASLMPAGRRYMLGERTCLMCPSITPPSFQLEWAVMVIIDTLRPE